MVYDLRDCVVLIVDSASGRFAVGSIADTCGTTASVCLRQRQDLVLGRDVTAIVRTSEGQALARARLLQASPFEFHLDFITRPELVQARTDVRGATPGVKAVCANGVRINVLDLSDGGLRFEAERELPVGVDVKARVVIGGNGLEVTFHVLRLLQNREGKWIGAGQFPAHLRLEIAKVRHLVNGKRSLGGNIVQGVGVGDGRVIVGTVLDIQDPLCTIALRGQMELRAKQPFVLAFRTATGQCTCLAQAVSCDQSSATLQFLSKLTHYQGRQSRRKLVKNVSAFLPVSDQAIRLEIHDISDTGLKFTSDHELPSTEDLSVLMSFAGTQVEATCRVVRQRQNALGNWQGGLLFCPQSRVELARLRRQITEAA